MHNLTAPAATKKMPNFKIMPFTQPFVHGIFFIGGGHPARPGAYSKSLAIIISTVPMIKSINALIVRSRQLIGFFLCFLFLPNVAFLLSNASHLFFLSSFHDLLYTIYGIMSIAFFRERRAVQNDAPRIHSSFVQ